MPNDNEGRGFRRLGPVGGRKRSEKVVPFDEKRINQAIEAAAQRMEAERIARGAQSKEVAENPALNPDEIEQIANKVLEKSRGCDPDHVLAMESSFHKQNLELSDYMTQLNKFSDSYIEENKIFCQAVARAFLKKNAERKHDQSPL